MVCQDSGIRESARVMYMEGIAPIALLCVVLPSDLFRCMIDTPSAQKAELVLSIPQSNFCWTWCRIIRDTQTLPACWFLACVITSAVLALTCQSSSMFAIRKAKSPSVLASGAIFEYGIRAAIIGAVYGVSRFAYSYMKSRSE